MPVKRNVRTRCATLGPRDPRGMVRATLLKVQSRRVMFVPGGTAPRRKPTRRPDVPWPSTWAKSDRDKGTSTSGATDDVSAKRRTDHLTYARHVTKPVSAGSPKGREPYGDRVPVVVRGRESRPHGEGEQVATMQTQRGT